MENRTRLIISLFFFLLTFITACDEEDEQTVFEIKNFEVTVDENPSNGFVLGKLEATTNKGEITFKLISESVEGALELDNAKAELRVKDNSKFNFETTTKITAKVNVSNADVVKTIDVVVNVKDLPESALETLVTKFNSVIIPLQFEFDRTLGIKFKVLGNNTVVSALGCAPVNDGEYTVTLYANDTEQVLATAKVQAIGASETKIKFFYTDLNSQINLEKDKTYTVAYFQPKNQKYFFMSNAILSDQTAVPGLTIIDGFYALGNSFPKEIGFVSAADVKIMKK
jgi:hypothetical protein